MLRSSLHKKQQASPPLKPATTRNVSWHTSVTIINDEKGPAQRSYSWRSETSSTSSEATCSPPVSWSSPLHGLISPDTKALIDIRLDPSIFQPMPGFLEPATMTRARSLRIISPDFPWTLEVKSRIDSPVTCGDVFYGIHTALSLPLTNPEWSLADEKKKNSIMRANRNRRGGSVRRLRRIDWLGSRVYFKGLVRDDGLVRTRLLPEDDFWPDTWVVKFSSR